MLAFITFPLMIGLIASADNFVLGIFGGISLFDPNFVSEIGFLFSLKFGFCEIS